MSYEDLASWLREQVDIDDRLADEMDLLTTAHVRVTVGVNAGSGPGARQCLDGRQLHREVEAKRRIIGDLLVAEDREIEATCWIIAKGILRLLALPYADRPGYREEWRP